MPRTWDGTAWVDDPAGDQVTARTYDGTVYTAGALEIFVGSADPADHGYPPTPTRVWIQTPAP